MLIFIIIIRASMSRLSKLNCGYHNHNEYDKQNDDHIIIMLIIIKMNKL